MEKVGTMYPNRHRNQILQSTHNTGVACTARCISYVCTVQNRKTNKYNFFSQEKTGNIYMLSFCFNGSEKDVQNEFCNKVSTGVNNCLEGFWSECITFCLDILHF